MLTPEIFTSIVDQLLPEPHASLMNGILFGIDIYTKDPLYEELKRSGLLHIVVLSGMNITLLGAMISQLTFYLHRNISACISILVIAVFVAFVGPDPPIVRAGIMGILSLLGIIYERKTYAMYLLFLTALIIGIVKTEWLTSVSFQLSFAATFGILIFGGSRQTEQETTVMNSSNRAHTAESENIESHNAHIKIQTKNQLEKEKQKPHPIIDFLRAELKTTFSAQVFTVPIIFIYFRQISLISPISNILISFTIPFIMILGFIIVGLGMICLRCAVLPSYIAYGAIKYVLAVIHMTAWLPYTYIDLNAL